MDYPLLTRKQYNAKNDALIFLKKNITLELMLPPQFCGRGEGLMVVKNHFAPGSIPS